MNSLTALGIRRPEARAVRPTGRVLGPSAALRSLPAGTYDLDLHIELAADVHERPLATSIFDAALRSTDHGLLSLASTDTALRLTPWSNHSGFNVDVMLRLELTAPADPNVLLRYVARGLNAAIAGTSPNGQPIDLQLGPQILAMLLSPTTLSSTANAGQILRVATVTISAPRLQPAPSAPPAPTPAPTSTPGHVTVAPTQTIPQPPPAFLPSARPTSAAISHFQGVLYALGWLPSLAEVDGRLGSHTTAALRLFQDNYNREQTARNYRFAPRQLTVNGQLDVATQQALENYRTLTRWLPEGQINGQSPAPTMPTTPVVQPPVVRPPTHANPTTSLVVQPPSPPVVRPPAVPEMRPPGTPQVVVAPPQPPLASATKSGLPWGTILLVAGTVAVGYTGYHYRHEIRAAFDTNAPIVRERTTAYAAQTRTAIRTGSKAVARRAGARLTRYGTT